MKIQNFFKSSKLNRNGLKDMWNAFMVETAQFSPNGIPLCPTTTTNIPKRLIGYDEAKSIHKRMMHEKKYDYHIDAFIHFYIDDSKFDGRQTSIWFFYQKALEIISHFDGIISPDFSTYIDFPDPLKRWNYYRMNAFGYWIGSQGYSVISNVRWDFDPSSDYSLDGNPHNSILCLGTVASSLKYKVNYDFFANNLIKMAKILSPRVLIVYGSSNYPCFDDIRNMGITVVTFPSKTSEYFKRRAKK